MKESVPLKLEGSHHSRRHYADVTAEVDTARRCSFPIGEPGTPSFRFCGEPTVMGWPYCRTHCAVAYQSRPVR